VNSKTDPLDTTDGRSYIIAWGSKETVISGEGATKFLHSEAVEIAEKANAEFPDLVHWVNFKPANP